MARNEFHKARKNIEVSVGEAVRIVRQLQGLSQNQLAELCGIPQPTISALENDRIKLGAERARILARALQCHPAVLLFPGWEPEGDTVGTAQEAILNQGR